jgi:hypothetical protein
MPLLPDTVVSLLIAMFYILKPRLMMKELYMTCAIKFVLQAKDITDLGTLKEASKIFVPGNFSYLYLQAKFVGCCAVFFSSK